jgi:hypothetical protein
MSKSKRHPEPTLTARQKKDIKTAQNWAAYESERRALAGEPYRCLGTLVCMAPRTPA